MIGYLSGKFLLADSDSSIILDVNGVGYHVFASKQLIEKTLSGSSLNLFIHTHVREDSLDLYGFETSWEKRVFLLLTSVSGIGPRTGMGVFHSIDSERLLDAIVRGDKAILTSVPGIGKKTADRILLELTDKAQKLITEKWETSKLDAGASKRNLQKTDAIPAQGASSMMGVMSEAASALVSLGYRDADAWSIVKESVAQFKDETPDLQKIIRTSLQRMAPK